MTRRPIDLVPSNYRIVDLSVKVTPALRKADGKYFHGEPCWGRMIYLDEFIFGPQKGVRMHFIRGETHVGTHLESSLKVSENGTDQASVPIENCVGEAAVVDCSGKKAGQPITVADLEKTDIRRGDRVLIRGPRRELDPAPYLSSEAAKWLVGKKIRLLAMENCSEYLPGEIQWMIPEEKHNALLLFKNGVVRIDGIVNLHELRRERVFLVALPLRFERLEASWTRAVALEPTD